MTVIGVALLSCGYLFYNVSVLTCFGVQHLAETCLALALDSYNGLFGHGYDDTNVSVEYTESELLLLRSFSTIYLLDDSGYLELSGSGFVVVFKLDALDLDGCFKGIALSIGGLVDVHLDIQQGVVIILNIFSFIGDIVGHQIFFLAVGNAVLFACFLGYLVGLSAGFGEQQTAVFISDSSGVFGIDLYVDCAYRLAPYAVIICAGCL